MHKHFFILLGTRPEAIKLFPVINRLKAEKGKDISITICATAQHRQLLDQVLKLAKVVPDFDLNVMTANQTLDDLTARLLGQIGELLEKVKPTRVIVQGDTATAMAGALASYYHRIPVSHIEAGLRSGDIFSPWPEEVNRKIVGSIADQHFAPTERAARALRSENVSHDRIHVTGNTVVDALILAKAMVESDPGLSCRWDGIKKRHGNRRIILVTCHRRENFGGGVINIVNALETILRREDVAVVLPVHPNPNVRDLFASRLSDHPRVVLISPQEYTDFVSLLSLSHLVLTDSGGVQEEAPTFGKPVLVMRDTTERPEGVDSQLGIGVVGYGYWGPNLVRNFSVNPATRVVSVSDLSPGRLGAMKQLYPAVETTTRYEDLLKDGSIDAIAIATPVHTHYELAMAALRAGKHVLVEKPLAASAELVTRLIDEADRRGLTLMVDHTFLYTPAVQKIRELLLNRELGDIYYYDSTRASLGLFQKDVNVIWDLAVHDISIIHHILDDAPVAVSATGSCHVAGSPENMAHITLFFANACVAHVSVNWLSPVKVRQTFIGGSKKMIVYDDLEPTEKIKLYDKGITLDAPPEDAHQFRIGYRAGDMWAPHIAPTEALQTEVEHFVDCVRTGSQPISGGISALRVIEVLEAASRSIAAQGKPVLLKQPHPVRERARATALM